MSGEPPAREKSRDCKRHNLLDLSLARQFAKPLWLRGRRTIRRFAKLLLSISEDGRQCEQEVEVAAAAPASDPPVFPPSSKLNPKKKAEMDYQSELDKQKAADQFWHTRRGIFWDKGIFGLLVAAVTALGLFVVYSTVERHRETDTRQLEKEKLDAAHQQFLMNKRLEALDAVAKAMSAVSRVYFDYTKEKKNALKEEAEKAYSEALANAQIAIDRAEILFPPGFDGDLERYYQVHKKISQIGVQKCDRYRDFLFSLSRQFDRICYMALVTRESADFQKKLAQPQMTLAKIPPEERDRMTDEAYLDKHHVYWKEHRNEAIDPLPFHPGR